jgi:NAD-specific glutamate dehydrogenase
VAVLRPLTATTDIADLAKKSKRMAPPPAGIYHQTGGALGFDRLRAAAAGWRAATTSNGWPSAA